MCAALGIEFTVTRGLIKNKLLESRCSLCFESCDVPQAVDDVLGFAEVDLVESGADLVLHVLTHTHTHTHTHTERESLSVCDDTCELN